MEIKNPTHIRKTIKDAENISSMYSNGEIHELYLTAWDIVAYIDDNVSGDWTQSDCAELADMYDWDYTEYRRLKGIWGR